MSAPLFSMAARSGCAVLLLAAAIAYAAAQSAAPAPAAATPAVAAPEDIVAVAGSTAPADPAADPTGRSRTPEEQHRFLMLLILRGAAGGYPTAMLR